MKEAIDIFLKIGMEDSHSLPAILLTIKFFKTKKMNNTSKVVIALAAGVAVGAILGILFAPAKGEETRKKMSEEGQKMAEELKSKFREAKEKFESAGEDFKKKMDKYA